MENNNNNQKHIESLHEEIYALKSIIRHMPGHLYWMDCHAVYQGCNQVLSNFFKLSHPDEIIGKALHDLWPLEIEETNSLNLSLMKTGTNWIGEEIAYTHQEPITFLSHKVILRDSKNNVTGLLGISFDITDRKQMEKALQVAKEKAEIANHVKTDFIRNMEHDLRTPLCGILGVTNHLLSIENNGEKKELLTDLEQAARELLNYFDHIVDYSQINQNIIPITKKEFDLKKLIQSIVSIESAAIRDKNLNLHIEYDHKTPMIVVGDRFRMHRILLNIVNNAIKFTEKGFIKITINCIFKEKENIILKITILDTGVGIAKENHEMIFDKFTRLDRANKNLYKGTGLGLWIVKEFVQDLEGNIELESELNKGTSFTFTIPFSIIYKEVANEFK